MAVEKDIAIHKSRGVRNCVEYVDDKDKCTVMDKISADVYSVLGYSQNTDKTTMKDHKVILTSGIMCSPGYAPAQFEKTARAYRRIKPEGTGLGSGGTKLVKDRKTGEMKRVAKESVEAYHVIQSFPAVAGLDPKLVHKIGKEYAAAAFFGHQCVVSTHMNTGHLHNHIVVCAYRNDLSGKFLMNKKARYRLRCINDELSLKYDLPILVGDDHRFENKLGIGEAYAKQAGRSFKEEIRRDIEKALSKDYVNSWPEFTIYMKSLGVDMRQTPKSVTYIMKYSDKKEHTYHLRDYRLGDKYMRTTICKNRGWEYPDEKQLTNYAGYLNNCYVYGSAKTDTLVKDVRTGRLKLHIDRYDENGRRRTLIEIALIAAIKIVRYFWDRHMKIPDRTQDNTGLSPVSWNPDRKLTYLLEGLELARTLKINRYDDIKTRKNDIGKKISVIRREFAAKEALAVNTLREYEQLENTDPQKESEYRQKLHSLADDYEAVRLKLSALNHEYTLLSRLTKVMDLARNPMFVMGPSSHPAEYPDCRIIEDISIGKHDRAAPDSTTYDSKIAVKSEKKYMMEKRLDCDILR